MSAEIAYPWAADANSYDTFRPRYPDDALNTLLRITHVEPGHRVVEFGAGTGIFTEQLLERSVHVVAVEPSPELVAVAQEKLAGYINDGSLTIIKTTAYDALINAFDQDKLFDGAFMATSRIWMDDTEGIFQRLVSQLLRTASPSTPAGCIASIRNVSVADDGGDQFMRATSEIHRRVLGNDTLSSLPYSNSIAAEPFGCGYHNLYHDVSVLSEQMSAERYLGRLGTFGPIAKLPTIVRAQLATELAKVAWQPPFNGTVRASIATSLDIAQRLA